MRLGNVHLHGPGGQTIECNATGELGLNVSFSENGPRCVTDLNFNNGKNDLGLILAIVPGTWGVVYGWEIDGVNVPAGTDGSSDDENMEGV